MPHVEYKTYINKVTIYKCMHLVDDPTLTISQIPRGFHRSFATDVASRQRMLIPPESRTCPICEFSFVLTLGPVFPKLDMFLDYQFGTSLGNTIFLSSKD